RRFSELKGQDHVVRALRDAVAGGREGQAYLFSGPRGTGKTTSARILAKVLNCERPVDGEPCCECDSCLAVERGTSYDVHELDAASNNGVDAMRDLIEKASLGTPGRHKVYILDEVHMLSKAAEAALLKTLEEPPAHVVFVLATTDPQKVSDTIRSRTQHLRFHLLAADALAEHVRWVVADAGLEVTEASIDAAIEQGAGSARDTLSALELIVSAGGTAGDTLSFDEFLEAMIDHEPGLALTAMAHAVNAGHEPRPLAEALVRHLRNGFLSLMAPELVQLSSHQVDQLAAQAQRLGPAALVRAIERLGQILVELRHAPDPRVLVEVALVQLTMTPPEAADDIGPLAARVAKLEQAAAAGPPPAVAPVDPATGRTALGGRARRDPADATGSTVRPPAAPPPNAPSTPSAAPPPPTSGPASAAAPAAATADGPAPSAPADVRREWDELKPALRGLVRALYTPLEVVGAAAGTVTLAAPNAAHRDKCDQHRAAVEEAWTAATGRPVTVAVVVGGDTGGGGGDSGAVADRDTPRSPPPRPATDGPRQAPPEQRDQDPGHEDIDLDDLVDAPPGTVPTTLDRLAQAFPGAELIEGGA
ncbi:MAG: DNA polymerase III subunit gamma/tau, partial [Ilumatobacteraceae bacterium]